MNPEVQARLRATFGTMGQLIVDIQAIAGYELPLEARRAFLSFHKFVTDPVPNYAAEWRSSPATEHWYHRHVNGVLGDVQSAVARAFYHRDRMAEIEGALLRAIEKVDYKSLLGNSSCGFGSTLKWDFEYQAFVLATRSALDYLCRALSAYFKDKSHSYNSWPRMLRAAKPKALADALLAVHEAQREGLVYLKQNQAGVSVRDRIAHHGHVSAATINLMPQGLFLLGGGEDLALNRDIPVTSLQPLIQERSQHLVNTIDAYLAAFIEEAANPHCTDAVE